MSLTHSPHSLRPASSFHHRMIVPLHRLLPLPLIVCAAPWIAAQPEGVEERSLQAEQWSGSQDAKQRLLAANWLIEERHVTPPVRILRKLLLDEDPAVARRAMGGLKSVTEMGRFSDEQAKDFLEISQKGLSSEALDELVSKDVLLPEITGMMDRLVVVNTLYMWYPLISPLSYDKWLTEQYGYFLRRLSSYRGKGIEGFDSGYLNLVHSLNGPQALKETLPFILEVEELSPDMMAETLVTLWGNPYCGANRPLNDILESYLRKNLERLERKCREADGAFSKGAAAIFTAVKEQG